MNCLCSTKILLHQWVFFWIAITIVQASLCNAQTRAPEREKKRIPPTHADVRYGAHERNVIDLYLAKSTTPTPLVLYIHGGGFRGGDKSTVNQTDLRSYLDLGYSVAAINYRLTDTAPAPAQYHDCARALQFLRHHAVQWNLDGQRVASTGSSAGAGTSMWLAFHDDLADPTSTDPIARESTRLNCVAVTNGQSSYDPRFAESIGIPRPNFDRHPFFLPFYGIEQNEIDSEAAYAKYPEMAPITFLSADDAPVWLDYNRQNVPVTTDSDVQLVVHHPLLGIELKRQMDRLQLECIIQYLDSSDRKVRHGDDRPTISAVQFIQQHLAPRAAARQHLNLSTAMEAGRPAAGQTKENSTRAANPRESVGLMPLTEMSANDRYHGQDGGLYGKGMNTPPAGHRAVAEQELARIQPLDAEGKALAEGKIGFVSISMSNATMEFSRFKSLADADTDKAPAVSIVDCAQGGQAMAEWTRSDARAWMETDRRLKTAGVSPNQVQVAWIKLANKGPRGDLETHGRQLQRDTMAVIQNAKSRFPNLRIAYLSSRIYAGYATNNLNPEPFAYESAFVVRWLIQKQITGDAALNFSFEKGTIQSPLLLWGPYLWADGTTPRKVDNLFYSREDLAADGTHPSDTGTDKVAKIMLDFFKNDDLAKPWFVR